MKLSEMLSSLDFIKDGPVLFIGAHPDDVELGCGGLISKLNNSIPIYVVTLSKNQKNLNNKNLVEEHLQSLKSLKIDDNKIILGDFTTREFYTARQKILDYLLDVGRKLKPTCVFIPPNDLHQDHQIVHTEALRAFRTITILAYDLARSTIFQKPEVFVNLSRKNLNDKIMALSKYKTYKNKNYFSKKSIESICQSYGIKCEMELCEIFYPISIML